MKRKRFDNDTWEIDISDFENLLSKGDIPLKQFKEEENYLLKIHHRIKVCVKGKLETLKTKPPLIVKCKEIGKTEFEVIETLSYESVSSEEMNFVFGLNLDEHKLIKEGSSYQKKRFQLKFEFKNMEKKTEEFVIVGRQWFDKVVCLENSEIVDNLPLTKIEATTLGPCGGDFMRVFFISKSRKSFIKSSKFEVKVNGIYCTRFSVVFDYSPKMNNEQIGFLMFETPQMMNARIQVFQISYQGVLLKFSKEKEFFHILKVK
jgi:hypothetical protein